MTFRLPRLEHALRVLGLAAAMLALVGRLASGTVAVDPQALAEVSAVLAAAVPCEADAAGAGGGHDRLPAMPDPGLAVLASFLSQPSPILTPVVFPPPPREGVVRVSTVLPRARAPPARPPGAALPRGPPVLV